MLLAVYVNSVSCNGFVGESEGSVGLKHAVAGYFCSGGGGCCCCFPGKPIWSHLTEIMVGEEKKVRVAGEKKKAQANRKDIIY